MSERCVCSSLNVGVAPALALLLFFGTSVIRAQNMPPLPADASSKPADAAVKVPVFDVASVKANKGSDGMMSYMTKPDGIETVNISLKNLISDAYGFNNDLIFGGPKWVDSKGYDISAKVAASDVEVMKKLTGKQRQSMLQPILVERFHLKVHTETKVLPTYDLTVAKGGVKMKQAEPDPPPAQGEKDEEIKKDRGRMTMRPGEFEGQDLPISTISSHLGYIVSHTVNDKTGLTAKYDLTLKYTPDSDDGSKRDDGSTDPPPPSIFTAVQEQLGLRLTSTKGPVETLVIDHAEEPSEN